MVLYIWQQVSLLIIDTLFPLCTNHASHISTFLSSLLISPTVSLLATYHTDVPLPSSPSTSAYLPAPLTTLTYLATSILTLSSLSEVLAQKRARDKSLQEPVFGLSERREGVLFGLKGNGKDEGKGVVVRMELRRKSGRGIVENFVLSPPEPGINNNTSSPKLSPVGEFILCCWTVLKPRIQVLSFIRRWSLHFPIQALAQDSEVKSVFKDTTNNQEILSKAKATSTC